MIFDLHFQAERAGESLIVSFCASDDLDVRGGEVAEAAADIDD